MNLGRLFTLSVWLRILTLLVSLSSTVILTRILEVDEYGSYVFALAVMNLVAIPIQAGLPQLVVRETSKLDQRGDLELLNGLLLRAIQGVVLLSATVLIIAIPVMVSQVSQRNGFADLDVILIAFLLVPLAALAPVLGAALRGFERISVGQFVGTVLRPIILLGLLFACLFFGFINTISAQSVMWLHVGAALISCIVAALILLRCVGAKLRGVGRRYETRNWLHDLWPLSLIAGLSILLNKTDILMLRSMTGLGDVAHYNVALQIGTVAFLANQGMRMVSQPRLARLHEAGDIQGMQTVLTMSARFVTLSTLPFAITFWIFGGDIIEGLFGLSYMFALVPALIFITGYTIQAVFGAAEGLLKMAGYERVILRSIPVALFGNVGLNAILIPIYGATGAAVATVLSTIFWKGYLALVAKRKLGLNVLAWGGKGI